MKAIETTYKGYRFRSRLEARWAVFFNTIPMRWEYEPEGFDLGAAGYYLPDFKVYYPGRSVDERREVWFEVKPSIESITQEEWKKLLTFNGGGPMLLDGPPALGAYLGVDSWLKLALGQHDDSVLEGMPDNTSIHKAAAENPPEIRMGGILHCGKKRIWWDEASNFFNCGAFELGISCGCSVCAIKRAVMASRQVRFEHDEKQRSL